MKRWKTCEVYEVGAEIGVILTILGSAIFIWSIIS